MVIQIKKQYWNRGLKMQENMANAMDVASAVYSKFFKLKQGFSILALEVHFDGEFSSNPN